MCTEKRQKALGFLKVFPSYVSKKKNMENIKHAAEVIGKS